MAIVNDHVFELRCKWCMKYDLSRHLSSFLRDIPWWLCMQAHDLWYRLGILHAFQNERRGRKRGSVKLWEHVNTYVISSLLRARNCHLSPPYSVTAREQEREREKVCVWARLCILVLHCQHKSTLPAIGELMLCFSSALHQHGPSWMWNLCISNF